MSAASTGAEPFVKEAEEKRAVEILKLAGTGGGAHLGELVGQVGFVAVEERFFLDEPDEHEPVEHQRGIPRAVGGAGQAGDEPGKRLLLLGEFAIEAFDNALGEGTALLHALKHIGQREQFLFLEREDEMVEALGERLAGGTRGEV